QRLMTALPVAFMFPGLGNHHVHMAAGLYQSEPIFRGHVDACSAQLRPHLGVDLREILYPPHAPRVPTGTDRSGVDLRRMLGRDAGGRSAHAQRLDQTELAQPALFVIEYALARLWQARGVEPQALIGYSLGEYVAACLAGVISLEDSLRLVA